MNRRIVLSLALAAALSLAACGNAGSTKDISEEPSAAEAEGSSVKSDEPVAVIVNPKYEEKPSAEPVKNPEIRLSFVGCGDNIVYLGNVLEAKASSYDGGREYNFQPTYELVRDTIASADIAFINQETLMSGDEFSYYPLFNGPQDMGYDLRDLGFDIVSLANNHMLDMGGDGLSKTIQFWKSMEGVFMIGGYENNDDYYTPRIYEKNGVKIAFLSYTYGTNGLRLSSNYDIAIPYLDEDVLREQIPAAKELADLVFVSVHWGSEGRMTPTDEQRRYAQVMADSGADVIIGHHPHVIEPVEWVTAEDGRQTLCVYSLGNFVAEQEYDYNTVGGMISFDIVKDDSGSRIESPLFTPTVCNFNGSFRNNCVYPMEQYTEELASAHGVRTYYHNSLSFDRLWQYVVDTIAPEFLPSAFRQ